MAKKLIDFLKEQGIKAGLKIDEVDELKTFFSTESIQSLEIPDSFTAPVENGFIRMSDAKNNHPEIKNFYHKQVLDQIDKRVDNLMEEYGFTDDEKNIVKVERNTYEKPTVLLTVLKKKLETASIADKPQLQSLQQTIDKLNNEIRAEKDKTTQFEKTYAQKEKDLKIRYALDGIISGYKTINDSLDMSVKATIVHQLLNAELQNSQAKFDLNEHGQLVLIKHDGSNVYGDSNTQILPKGFVEKTLSANKLLVTTDKSGPQTPTDGPKPPSSGDGKQKGATPGFKHLMDKAIQDAGKPSTAFGGGN